MKDTKKKFVRFVRERSKKKLRPRTIELYLQRLRSMENQYGLDLERVDQVDHVRAVFVKMDKVCSAATQNSRRLTLKIFLEFKGVELTKEMKNVLKNKSGPKRQILHPKYLLTLEELEDITQHTKIPALRAYWYCLYDTGSRPGALCDLTVSDLTQDRHGYVFTFKSAKTEQSKRPVRLLMPTAIQYFEQWWAIHPRKNDSDAPLFINSRRRKFRPVSLTIQLKKYHEKRLGRGPHGSKAPLNLYLFRKTRATRLLKEKVFNEIEVKMRLGHEKHSQMLAQYYAILDEEDQAEAELRYLGVTPKEEGLPQPVSCPSCGAPNDAGTASCHRCRLPLTEEEVIRQQRVAQVGPLEIVLEDREQLQRLARALELLREHEAAEPKK